MCSSSESKGEQIPRLRLTKQRIKQPPNPLTRKRRRRRKRKPHLKVPKRGESDSIQTNRSCHTTTVTQGMVRGVIQMTRGKVVTLATSIHQGITRTTNDNQIMTLDTKITQITVVRRLIMKVIICPTPTMRLTIQVMHLKKGYKNQPTDECEKDVDRYTSEIFMMDRTTKFTPLQIYSVKPEHYVYNMTDELLKLLEEEFKEDPKKLKVYTDLMPKPMSCALWKPRETSTGVLSDVDGDGTIDLITTIHMEAKLRCGDYTLSKIRTYVLKINLAEVMHKKQFVPIGPFVATEDAIGHKIQGHTKDIMEVTFASLNMQPWRQYMGSNTDNIYKREPIMAAPSHANTVHFCTFCMLSCSFALLSLFLLPVQLFH